MANVNAQDLLKDNQDNLEKKSGSLSVDETKALDKVKLDTDVIDAAQKKMLQVKTKEGTPLTVSAKVLMEAIAKAVPLAEGRNYKEKLQSANIELKVGSKTYAVDTAQLGRGSEVIAFLQVAAGGNLVPDGKFGQATADAFSKFVAKTEGKETANNANFEKVGLNEISTHNFYDNFVSLFGEQAAKQYKNTYLAFKNSGAFTACSSYNGEIKVAYKSKYEDQTQFISFKETEIQDTRLNVDVQKFLNTVKSKIDAKEIGFKKAIDKKLADLNAKNLRNSVQNGVDDLKVAAFTNPLVREFITAKKWTTNGELDFKSGVGAGMVAENGLLKITIPGQGPKGSNYTADWRLSDIQSKGIFDQTKFIKKMTETILPWAKAEKAKTLNARYDSLVAQKPASINVIPTIDAKIANLRSLDKTIKEAISQGVVLDSTLSNGITQNIDGLNKQKNYLLARNWFDKDLAKFEKAVNATGEDRLSRQQETSLAQMAKTEYETLSKGGIITALKLSPKVVYEQVAKKNEFDAYLKRYASAAAALD